MRYSETKESNIDALYEQAYQDYNHSEAGKLRQQLFERMDKECHDYFTADEEAFIHECFSALLENCGARERFTYECGIRDGIVMLKLLNVL